MAKKILIDCDPGLDDFLAILSALRMPELEVLGICSVAGNVSLASTTRNVGSILTLAGREDIPYAAGSPGPLLRTRIQAEKVHGPEGRGSLTLPEPACPPIPTEAPDFLWQTARENPGMTLITLGPLTNAARAILGHPELKTLLGQIVLMGGGWAWGNAEPKAEFNILADPHAAHIVFDSGIPLTMVGLDATMDRALSPEEYQALPFRDTPAGRLGVQAVKDMADCYIRQNMGDVVYIHDLTAVICAAHPEAFRLKECRVDVELKGKVTFGQTVCDVTGVSGKPANASVAMGVKEEVYLPLLRSALASI